MPLRRPLKLLTLRRICRLTRTPGSVIRDLLIEHPEIQPAATADGVEVFDRDGFLTLLALLEQHEGRHCGGARRARTAA